MKPATQYIVVAVSCFAFPAIGCGPATQTPTSAPMAQHVSATPLYQRFISIQVNQTVMGLPIGGLALDTKTGLLCKTSAGAKLAFPLCVYLFASYPDDKTEVEGLRKQIEVDELGFVPDGLPPCPSDDPLGLKTSQSCAPLPPRKGESK